MYYQVRSENASSRMLMARLIRMTAVIAAVAVKTVAAANLKLPRTVQTAAAATRQITALVAVVRLIIFAKMDTIDESSCRN